MEELQQKIERLELEHLETSKMIEDHKKRIEILENFISNSRKKSSSNSVEPNVINFDLAGRGVKVSGDTKKQKEVIKTMGGKWNPSMKSWILTIPKAKALKQFLESFDELEIRTTNEYTIRTVSSQLPGKKQ